MRFLCTLLNRITMQEFLRGEPKCSKYRGAYESFLGADTKIHLEVSDRRNIGV